MQPRLIMKMRLTSSHLVTPDIRLLRFVRANGQPLPPQPPGAHVDVHLPNGHVNQYSLCGDRADTEAFTIAVQRQPEGRGGSEWLHAGLSQNDVVPISAPRDQFSLAKGSRHTLLLAAGIGITPILSMARALHAEGSSFELHYSTRTGSGAPFAEELGLLCPPGRFFRYSDGRHALGALRPAALVERMEVGTAVYCCGPEGYMDAVRAACACLPEDSVHFEAFKGRSDDGFVAADCRIQIVSTGQVLEVPADVSMLSVLEQHGFRVPSKCVEGVCGTCEIGYRSGKVIHRDVVLGPKARQQRLMPCVSRTASTVLLDL